MSLPEALRGNIWTKETAQDISDAGLVRSKWQNCHLL
jgi:hypothetical protein